MAPQPSPWQADILATFNDEATQDAVDNFLRSRVQPRVTQLEQERAAAEQQYAETQDARQLMESFQRDPVKTFNDVKQQLIDLGYTIEEAQAATVAAATEAANAAAAQPAAPVADPRLDEMYNAFQQERELQAYDAMVAQIVNDPRNGDINPNRLHLYVSAAEGNFDRALEMYRADVSQILGDYGIDPNTASVAQQHEAAEIAAGQVPAPAVMGQAAGGVPPVPTTPDYRQQGMSPQDALHRGIEDAVANMSRGRSAPPIA